MIPTYTLKYLSMYICSPKYFLPFDIDVKDDEILEKTIKLFTDIKIYEHELYILKKLHLFNDTKSISPIGEAILIKDNEIKIKCLYEGYEEYYAFSILLTIFRLEDDKKWMMTIDIEHEYSSLLDELIDIKTIPKIKSIGLVKYSFLE